MGKCIYCGQPAGWFSHQHKKCEAAHQEKLRAEEAHRQAGKYKAALQAHAALNGETSLAGLPGLIFDTKSEFSLSDKDTAEVIINAWEAAVDAFLEDGLLVEEEEQRLVHFASAFDMKIADMPGFDRLIKSAALTDLFNGKIPNRFHVPNSLPVNLLKGEQIVWTCANVAYLEDKTRRQYSGGSQGVSLRIVSGVYYRVGAFKGQPTEFTERVYIDDGWLIVTTKNIYFSGPKKSLRIPYSKIVSFEPFNDGIGMHRDAATAKPQIFVTGDGWFTYNLITNLAQR